MPPPSSLTLLPRSPLLTTHLSTMYHPSPFITHLSLLLFIPKPSVPTPRSLLLTANCSLLSSFPAPHSSLLTTHLSTITPHPSSLTYHFHSLIRIFGGLSEFFTCLTEIFSPIYKKAFAQYLRTFSVFQRTRRAVYLVQWVLYDTAESEQFFVITFGCFKVIVSQQKLYGGILQSQWYSKGKKQSFFFQKGF